MGFERNMLPEPAEYFEQQGMQLKGPGKWKTTRCDFHGGSDSMRVCIASGGWICMACGAKGGDVLAHHMAVHGQDFVDSAKALGAWVDDGREECNLSKRALSPRQALQALRLEATLIAIEAGRIANGVVPDPKDVRRLLTAAGRVLWIAEGYQ